MPRFTVETIFKAVDKMSRPVTRMQNKIGKFTRRTERGMKKLNRAAGNVGKGFAKGLAIGGVALTLFGAGLVDVINTGKVFEQNIINAAAKFPGEIKKGTKAFQDLENAALKAGKTTEFTASDSAEALNFLAMAGFDSVSAIAALPGVIDLATAANIDLAQATDIASDSLGAFGLMTKDAQKNAKNLARVNDVMALTTIRANTNMEMLFETFTEAGPVATTAGASIETVAALAAALANAGIKGGAAGTTLKNMFLSLAAQTPKAQKELAKLGVKTRDSAGDLLDIVDVIESLNKGLGSLGTAEKSEALKNIFGKIPIAGVNVLLGAGAESLRAFRKEAEAADKVSNQLAATTRDSLNNSLKSLGSAIEGVKLKIFNTSKGPLNEVIKKMTEWVRANEDLIATNVGGFLADLFNNFSEIVKWGKRIAIFGVVLLGLVVTLKTLIGVLTLVNLVMAANPIVLITLAVIAAVAAIASMIIFWEDLSVSVKRAAAVFAFIMGPIGWLIFAGVAVAKNWDIVVAVFDKVIDHLKTIGSLFKNLATFNLADAAKDIAHLRENDKQFGNLATNLAAKAAVEFGFADKVVPKEDKPMSELEAPEAPSIPDFALVNSPQERISRSIEEKNTKNTLTIKDESNRAQAEGPAFGDGSLILAPSGGF